MNADDLFCGECSCFGGFFASAASLVSVIATLDQGQTRGAVSVQFFGGYSNCAQGLRRDFLLWGSLNKSWGECERGKRPSPRQRLLNDTDRPRHIKRTQNSFSVLRMPSPPGSEASLQSLPLDIFTEHLLAYLSYSSVLNLSATSKSLHSNISTPLVWQAFLRHRQYLDITQSKRLGALPLRLRAAIGCRAE